MPAAGQPDEATSQLVARGALVVVLCVVLGALAGVVWWKVAPVAQVRIESNGGFFVDPDPEQYVASDAWFGALTALVGLGAGLYVWRVTRSWPLVAVVGLTLGGVLGSLVAWQVGKVLGRVDVDAVTKLPVGTVVAVRLDLVAKGLLVVFPVVAVGTWLACDLVSDLRRRRASATLPAFSPADPPQPPPPPSS